MSLRSRSERTVREYFVARSSHALGGNCKSLVRLETVEEKFYYRKALASGVGGFEITP